MKATFKHELGTEVREIVSGFTGIVTGNLVYLNGCKQCCVRPKIDPGKPHEAPEGSWFDEQYLVREGSGIIAEMSQPATAVGVDSGAGSDSPAPSGSAHG